MDIIFLGINDVGWRVYEWLCNRDNVTVSALVTTKEQLRTIRKLEPAMLVSVGYGHILPPEILNIPDRGCINLHPSLLPYNRGANPNVWSIVEETPAGATLHYMDEGVDTGAIIAQREVTKDLADTGKDLHEKLEDAQFELFTNTWEQIIADTVETTEQTGTGTYHKEREFEELCELHPNDTHTTKDFLNRLRALTFPPYDNAYIEVEGTKYYIDLTIREEDDTAVGK